MANGIIPYYQMNELDRLSVRANLAGSITQIHDMLDEKDIAPSPKVASVFPDSSTTRPIILVPQRTSFRFTVPPHSYMAFAAK